MAMNCPYPPTHAAKRSSVGRHREEGWPKRRVSGRCPVSATDAQWMIWALPHPIATFARSMSRFTTQMHGREASLTYKRSPRTSRRCSPPRGLLIHAGPGLAAAEHAAERAALHPQLVLALQRD